MGLASQHQRQVQHCIALDDTLMHVRDISARLDAVAELRDAALPFFAETRTMLKGLSDLERGLSAIFYRKARVANSITAGLSAVAVLDQRVPCHSGVAAGRACAVQVEPGLCSAARPFAAAAAAYRRAMRHQSWRCSRVVQDISTSSAAALGFVRAVHKAAALERDKERLFVDESPYPDMVAQKRAIQSIEGAALHFARVSPAAAELAAYKDVIRKTLRLSSFDYTKVRMRVPPRG